MSVSARLAENERRAADTMERLGVMISRPGDGIEESGLKWSWDVCVGSHGGYGDRLIEAMRACMKCCGIGEWWRLEHGEGELMKDAFARFSRELAA